MKTKHSPTPWLVDGFGDVGTDDYRETICTILNKQNEKAAANAAHIVKCVNLFDEMVQFLESINGNVKDNAMDQYLTDLLRRAKGEE